ncbi:hypothetical protein OC835_007090 [Tilletia horrida]|nr:hypothetical protein OC835_007090 [Tilletia horrida]
MITKLFGITVRAIALAWLTVLPALQLALDRGRTAASSTAILSRRVQWTAATTWLSIYYVWSITSSFCSIPQLNLVFRGAAVMLTLAAIILGNWQAEVLLVLAAATICGWAFPVGLSAAPTWLRLAVAVALVGFSYIAGRHRLLQGFDFLVDNGLFEDLGLLPDHRRELDHKKAKRDRRLLKSAQASLQKANARIRLLEARLSLSDGQATPSPPGSSPPGPSLGPPPASLPASPPAPPPASPPAPPPSSPPASLPASPPVRPPASPPGSPPLPSPAPSVAVPPVAASSATSQPTRESGADAEHQRILGLAAELATHLRHLDAQSAQALRIHPERPMSPMGQDDWNACLSILLQENLIVRSQDRKRLYWAG